MYYRNRNYGCSLVLIVLAAFAVVFFSVADFVRGEWTLWRSHSILATINSVHVVDITPGHSSKIYTPEVHYSYKIGDQLLQSEQLSLFAIESNDLAEMRALISPFKPGHTCRGWVSDDNDSNSILIKHLPPYMLIATWWSLVIFGVVLSLILSIKPVNYYDDIEDDSEFHNPLAEPKGNHFASGFALFLFSGVASLSACLIYAGNEATTLDVETLLRSCSIGICIVGVAITLFGRALD